MLGWLVPRLCMEEFYLAIKAISRPASNSKCGTSIMREQPEMMTGIHMVLTKNRNSL